MCELERQESARPRGRKLILGGALVLIATLDEGPGAKPREPSSTADAPSIDLVLERLTRVAKLYRDQALRFTCDETITHEALDVNEVHRFRYIYRYSAQRQALDDYREPRGRAAESSARKKERARLENYGLPEYLLRAYSWIFAFEDDDQPYFQYEIIGVDEILDRPALRVRFDGIPPYVEGRNDWCGTAWVDRESWQLLHVEAVPGKDCPTKARLEEQLASPGDDLPFVVYPITRVTTEFDIERNGMRFPGRVTLVRTVATLASGRGKPVIHETPVFRVTQTYKRYQFFGVRTHEEVTRFVDATERE